MNDSASDSGDPVDWAQLLGDYREGPKALYGPVLVSHLGAYIAMAARHYEPCPPAIEAEDIHQQMVLEVLEEAARMPIPLHAEWVPRQLILRASQSVARWLGHEVAPTLVAVEQGLVQEPGVSIGASAPEFTSIGLSEEDLTLLHRFHVLDERTEDLADEVGVSVDTLRRRVSRARARGRRLAARIQRRDGERRRTQNERPSLSDSGQPSVQLRIDGAHNDDDCSGLDLPSRPGTCFPDSR